MIVERNGLGELGARLIILLQAQVSGTQGIVGRYIAGINGSGYGQVLQRALQIFPLQKLIALVVLVTRFRGGLKVEL